MRFSHVLAPLLVLTSVAVAQLVVHVPPSKGKPATGLSSLPPDAQRAILSALEEDAPGSAQQAERTASDGEAGDEFGYSISVDGGTVVVGAPKHPVGLNVWQGAVYVFVQSGGTWTQQAELSASDGGANDYFGASVVISGGTVVVGAPDHAGQGAAYVFVQNGGTWTQQAELTTADGLPNDGFGGSVALSASTVVVGAANRTVGSNIERGAAYVFVQSGDTWSQQAELTASDGAYGDNFGWSVAVDGSTALVSAYRKTFGSNVEQGAAYVFVQSGDTWSQQAELTASDGAAYDQFGYSVALNGSTAVVGANYHKVGSNTHQGVACMFVQSGGTWTQQAELSASDGAAYDQFGYSVALNGTTIVVGAPYHSTPTDQGAAYVFAQGGGAWTQQDELTASDGADLDYFGFSVAVSGSTAVVGVPEHAVNLSRQGGAYVFSTAGYTLSATPSSLNVMQAGQGATTITITPVNGFSRIVSLSVSGLPNGVTAAFNPNPATSTSALTLTASTTATTGTATVTVTGASGTLTQTTQLTVTVASLIAVTLSSPSLSFGNEALNYTGAAKTVVLKNTGTTILTISGISILLSTDFKVSSNGCGSRLAVGKTCKVSVTFTPTQLGLVTGILSFTDNAPNSPQTAALSGTGVEPAALTPASHIFPKTKVGNTSLAYKFTLKNNLSTIMSGISPSTTGPFAVSTTTCGTTLASKASCTISVTFSPTQIGTVSGTLTVSDSANNNPQTSSLSGTGD